MSRDSLSEAIRSGFANLMKSVGTSIPGHVLAFDAGTQLAQVQIGIQRIDVNGKSITPAPLIQVPVCFPGGDFCIEYQIDPGTEGLLIVSQRCIDAWMDQGGIAPPSILRFHDMHDALFIPGFRSQPNKLAAFQNNGVRLRNGDGSRHIWLKSDGTAEINVTTLNITGNTAITGTLTNNGVNVGSTHTHSGIAPGGGNTGVPNP